MEQNINMGNRFIFYLTCQSSSCALGTDFLNAMHTHVLVAFVLTWCGCFSWRPLRSPLPGANSLGEWDL